MKTEIYIHPSAEVNQKAEIGAGTKVWNNVQIREKVQIGLNCILSKDVYIDTGVIIGDGCKIQNGVSIYNGVTIESHVFIGPEVAFTNDKVPRAFNKEWKVTPTLIRVGASIGANATIVCGITIGDYAMVAAGSVVTKSIPNQALVMGNPSRIVGYVCKCGHRLDEENYCVACQKKSKID